MWDTSDGSLVWSTVAYHGIDSQALPAVAIEVGGRLAIAANSGITTIDSRTGREKWRWTYDIDGITQLDLTAVGEEMLYLLGLHATGGQVWSVRSDTGDLEAKTDIPFASLSASLIKSEGGKVWVVALS